MDKEQISPAPAGPEQPPEVIKSPDHSLPVPPPPAAPPSEPVQSTPVAPAPAPAVPSPPEANETPAPAAPAAASGDQDVIEPVWVKKVERIIETKADDPYEEEEAGEALQQEYLKDRFGKDIKKDKS